MSIFTHLSFRVETVPN